MLIVLSGEAGAGKDSVAGVLVDRHGFTKLSLAAPLKRFLKDMFGFTDEQLYGASHARNEHNPRWDLKCVHCGGSGMHPFAGIADVDPDRQCHGCGGTGRTEISVRSTAQPLGSEYLRDMVHPDCLTYRASWDIRELMAQGKDVVVNDARYQNDRNNLHDWLGAHRVHVVASSKAPAPYEAWRQHPSERDQPRTDEVEHLIENPEEWPFPSLPARVAGMLASLR